MAVFAKGAGRPGSDRTQEKMIAAAIGTTDPYGNPFTLIRLKSTRVMASHTVTHNYEDAFVFLDKRSGELAVEYRMPGSLKWMRPSFGGKPIALCARTPHNLKMLSRSYFDGSWVIMDAANEREIKALAEAWRKTLTPEQVKGEERRIHDLNHKPEGGAVVSRSGKSAREEVLSEREKKIAQREIAVTEREAKVGSGEEAQQEQAIAQVVKSDANSMMDPARVRLMKWYELKRAARSLGIRSMTTTTKDELLKMVLKHIGADKGEGKLPPLKGKALSAKDVAEGLNAVDEGGEPEQVE